MARDHRIRVHAPSACKTRSLAVPQLLVSAAWKEPRRLVSVRDGHVVLAWFRDGRLVQGARQSLPGDVRRAPSNTRHMDAGAPSLERCPCCPSRAVALRRGRSRCHVECTDCGLRTGFHATAEGAAATWNRRREEAHAAA